MSATLTEMPFIDPNVEHVGVSRLRQLDGKELRKIDKKALVIREHDSLWRSCSATSNISSSRINSEP